MGWAPDVWQAVADAGFPWVSIAEAAGGSGGTLTDAAAIVRIAGALRGADPPRRDRSARRLAGLAAPGSPLPDGPVTVVPGTTGRHARAVRRHRARAAPSRVAWGRKAERVVALLADGDGWVVASIAGRMRPRRARHEPRRRATGHARVRPGRRRDRPRAGRDRPGRAAPARRADAGAADGGRPRSHEPAHGRLHPPATSVRPAGRPVPSRPAAPRATAPRTPPSSRWRPRSPPPPPSGARPPSRSPPPRCSPARRPRPPPAPPIRPTAPWA